VLSFENHDCSLISLTSPLILFFFDSLELESAYTILRRGTTNSANHSPENKKLYKKALESISLVKTQIQILRNQIFVEGKLMLNRRILPQPNRWR
jgi:hypothetical protein